MNWLKEHVYLAAWLALPIMVVIALIQNARGMEVKGEAFPLKKILAYLMFLICFPLSISPIVDGGTRALLFMLAIALLITILVIPESTWRK